MKTALYRHYDKNDVLLYVGITDCLSRRTKEHGAKAAWFNAVVRTETTYCLSREHAVDCERVAIRHERPLHNKAPGPRLVESPPAHALPRACGAEYAGPPTPQEHEFSQIIDGMTEREMNGVMLMTQMLHLLPDNAKDCLAEIAPDQFIEVANRRRVGAA